MRTLAQGQRGFGDRAVPGITGVGLAVVPLLDGDEWDSSMTMEGYQR